MLRDRQIVYVRPADGAHVRDPRTKRPLPPGGGNVEWGSYWARRLAEGAVVESAADVVHTTKDEG